MVSAGDNESVECMRRRIEEEEDGKGRLLGESLGVNFESICLLLSFKQCYFIVVF